MNTRVELACGHDRIAPDWNGYEGSTYCCNACHVLTIMEKLTRTMDAPTGWRYRGHLLPTCPVCGAAPGAMHGRSCVAEETFWVPTMAKG